MRVVDAAVTRRDLRELDHLVRGGVAARSVVESRRHADGTLVHAAPNERAHRVELGGGRRAVGHPEHGTAHRALRDIERGVRPDPVLGPGIERLADLDGSTAIVVRDDRRHALHQIREIRALPWIAAAQITLRVRVGIDESGRDDQSTHVDDALRRQVRVAGIADEDDPIAANRDVGNARRRAASVDDGATTKKEVHVFAGRVRGSRDSYCEECPG